MMAGAAQSHDARSLRRGLVRRVLIVVALLGVEIALGIAWPQGSEGPASGPTVAEKVAVLLAERASLRADADGAARVGLLPAFRVASLLTDALAVRSQDDDERTFDSLPAFRLRAFAELGALNAVLGDALERPGEGARLAANKAAERASAELDRLAALDKAPLILSFTPHFVPPRRLAGELTLPAGPPPKPPRNDDLQLGGPSGPPAPAQQAPTVPRYAPDFAAPRQQDPPVEIEIVGSHLASGGPSPALSVGAWRGTAVVAPGRLRFAVPRSAFATDARRTRFVVATLTVRGVARMASFQLLFTVLPDRPGAFALDQRVQTTSFESRTLLSPEIVVRAPTGESRTVKRCFDPPPGWRFDPDRRRVVIVERLGWQNDMSDPTLNRGSVEFVPQDKPGQICVAVSARAVTNEARTATIGRFEATLLRDRPADEVVKSGIRALDWREPVRVPIEPNMLEWKLYVRLFDEIDREFDSAPASTAFLRVTRDDAGRAIVLQADPTAEP